MQDKHKLGNKDNHNTGRDKKHDSTGRDTIIKRKVKKHEKTKQQMGQKTKQWRDETRTRQARQDKTITRQDNHKTRQSQDKAWQDYHKTRQNYHKTTRDMARQDNPRWDDTRHHKKRETTQHTHKKRQYSTRQDKITQEKTANVSLAMHWQKVVLSWQTHIVRATLSFPCLVPEPVWVAGLSARVCVGFFSLFCLWRAQRQERDEQI